MVVVEILTVWLTLEVLVAQTICSVRIVLMLEGVVLHIGR